MSKFDSDMTTKELDEKLVLILNLEKTPYDVRRSLLGMIKQAFKEAGYMQIDALELKLIRAIQELDQDIRAEYKSKDQEWYERFQKEIDKLTTSVNGIVDAGLTSRTSALLAARRAAGIEEEK